MTEPLLQVRGLTTSFSTRDAEASAVRGVDFSLAPGQVLGIVGESGSGKSVAMMSLLQLLPPSASVRGSAIYKGRDLIGMHARELRAIRGKEIGCIFQDPLSAFNPVRTVSHQIIEAIRLHDRRVSKREALERAEDLLDSVAIPQPKQRLDQYPHEFSGGMRQRAMIAMALANNPKLLIADEPTTALDVTVQAQILDLLRELTELRGIATILITHDLGVVAGMADDIMVMYAGRVVERGTAEAIFYHTQHPYTRGLIDATPNLDKLGERLRAIDGTPPSIWNRPGGCSFAPRCSFATGACRAAEPDLRSGGATETACIRIGDLSV